MQVRVTRYSCNTRDSYKVDVCLLQRNLEDTAVRDEIRALGRRAEIVHLDISDQASVRTVIDRVLQVFPTLDILVNNAGIQKRHEYVVLTSGCE